MVAKTSEPVGEVISGDQIWNLVRHVFISSTILTKDKIVAISYSRSLLSKDSQRNILLHLWGPPMDYTERKNTEGKNL